MSNILKGFDVGKIEANEFFFLFAGSYFFSVQHDGGVREDKQREVTTRNRLNCIRKNLLKGELRAELQSRISVTISEFRSEFQKPRAPGHEFGIKNNFIPYGDTSEKAVPVEFVPIFFV